MPRRKINIAISGGSCTGKSVLADYLFASQKSKGFDYDLIFEESRKLRKEFGNYRSPFERFYMWRQQEREELRSVAEDGFITDAPLFSFYVSSRMYAREPRDKLAIRELFRMCLETEDTYQLIIIAKNPREIHYAKDNCRSAEDDESLRRHNIVQGFVEHFWPEKLLFVEGAPNERLSQVESRLDKIRNG